MDNLESIIFHRVMIPGLSGDGMTVAEASALRSDIAAYAAQLAAFGLDDLTDVSTAGATDNQALIYDSGTGAWGPGTPPAGYVSQIVKSGDASTAQNNVSQIVLVSGLTTAYGGSEGSAYILPVYGGSGTAATIARSDHTHTTPTSSRATFAPGGYMSSGTRSLTSTTVTLLADITYRVKATLNMQMRGADPGACYYRLSVTVNGNTRTSGSGANGYWCVQGVPDKTTWDHSQTITGTGAAITVSAAVQYDSGGGFYTDAGDLLIELFPNH